MTYVVGAICINCKHTTCVGVCPVDAHDWADVKNKYPDDISPKPGRSGDG